MSGMPGPGQSVPKRVLAAISSSLRKVFQQCLGRDAADVQIDVGMPAQQKECSVHPERPPAMCQQNLQPGKINRDIIDVNGVSVLVARAVKN